MSAGLGDALLQRVKARCEAWAEWYSRGQTYGLGYPSTSLLYRVIQGTGMRRLSHPASVSCAQAVEEMEAWIVEMAAHSPGMAKVLRCYYLESPSLRQGARRLGISHTYFRSQLALAHHWLAGKLSLALGV